MAMVEKSKRMEGFIQKNLKNYSHQYECLRYFKPRHLGMLISKKSHFIIINARISDDILAVNVFYDCLGLYKYIDSYFIAHSSILLDT